MMKQFQDLCKSCISHFLHRIHSINVNRNSVYRSHIWRYFLLAICVTGLIIFGQVTPTISIPIAQRSDSLQTAIQLQEQALTEHQQGDLIQAKNTIEESISLIESLPPTTHQQQVLANSLNLLGEVYFAQGYYQAALDTWEQLTPIYTYFPELSPYQHRTLIRQSQAQQNLGLTTQSCQTLLTSLNVADPLDCDGAIAQSETLVSNQNQANELTIQSFIELADLWREMGKFKAAENILDALPYSAGDVPLQIQLAKANLARSRGDQERSRQEATKGIQFTANFCPTSDFYNDYQTALENYQEIAQVTTDSELRLRSQLYALSLSVLTQQTPSVQPLIDDLIPRLSKADWQFDGLQYAQTLHCARPEYQSGAIEIVEELGAIAQQQGNRQIESYAQGYLGRFYEATKRWGDALEATDRALELSREFPYLDYQWQWQKARLLRAKGAPREQSLAFYKKAYDELQKLRDELVAFNPELQYDFRDRVEPLYREYVDLLLQPSGRRVKQHEQPTEIIQDDLKKAQEIVESLQLAELDNFFSDACAVLKKQSIDEIDRHAAIVYPILLKDRVFTILKISNQENLEYSETNLNNQNIEENVIELQELLISSSSPLGEIKQKSGWIYNEVFKLILDKLEQIYFVKEEQIKTLVFVSDGALRNIPPAILYDGEKFLIERYAVVVSPGLSLVDARKIPYQNYNAILAGANQAESFSREDLYPLDFALSEIQNIAQLLERKSKQIILLPEEKFLHDTVTKIVTHQPIQLVHLATHGKFSSNPAETYILDWQERIGIDDLDQLLRGQVNTTENPLSLLILSACKTASGDRRASLGLAGVALRAGAQSTIASLWTVNDRATEHFMQEFYRELINHPEQSKAEILRNIQCQFLHKEINLPGQLIHKPYFWAAFNLVGSWL